MTSYHSQIQSLKESQQNFVSALNTAATVWFDRILKAFKHIHKIQSSFYNQSLPKTSFDCLEHQTHLFELEIPITWQILCSFTECCCDITWYAFYSRPATNNSIKWCMLRCYTSVCCSPKFASSSFFFFHSLIRKKEKEKHSKELFFSQYFEATGSNRYIKFKDKLTAERCGEHKWKCINTETTTGS